MESGKLRLAALSLGGALFVSGVTGAIYYMYKKKSEEAEVDSTLMPQWITLEVKVPIDCVGLIIGRQGTNIKLIQEKTNTKINFTNDEMDGARVCVICGSESNAMLAQNLIVKTIKQQPLVESMDIHVPAHTVGRIIGYNGDNIRSIQRKTACKIIIEREENDMGFSAQEDGVRRMTIKGTKEQIESARLLIQEKVQELEEMRKQIHASAVSRVQRSKTKSGTPDYNSEPHWSISSQEESLVSSSNQFLEAYVSAMDSATHFWIQVVGPRSIQLDKLVDSMTKYYSNEDNQEMHELEKVQVGDIVAARFSHDGSWYRGQVRSFNPNEEDPRKSEVTLYYVDFGDVDTIPISNVFELRTDYLKLNFQAIECFLANIKPESATSDEAVDLFEELSYVALWKIVMVKVVSYEQRDGRTFPYVQVIDTNGPNDIDIAEELVARGVAEWTNEQTLTTSSRR
ncbi:tudor and KH domain-containing protein homolog [Oratosquilla oratoria]|uniref:tudor and KH domain-containing protein homolog n=1 Tax=Oratosquilla oratoria TaxID=337810 RepID=UPI003F761DF6